jgi:hypothetical protein
MRTVYEACCENLVKSLLRELNITLHENCVWSLWELNITHENCVWSLWELNITHENYVWSLWELNITHENCVWSLLWELSKKFVVRIEYNSLWELCMKLVVWTEYNSLWELSIKFAMKTEYIQWNLCNLTPEFSDILWHPTKIYGPKVFLLTKMKPDSDILYNLTHFPDSTVFCYENWVYSLLWELSIKLDMRTEYKTCYENWV